MDPAKEQIPFIAKTFHGLENVLAEELKALGAGNLKVLKRAVSFTGNRQLLYQANLCCRTALSVLKPVLQFKADNEISFYKRIREFDWSPYLSYHQTLAINSVVRSRYFNHSHYMALKAKDAIADHFLNKTGKRPSVNREDPDLLINVHIYENRCSLSLDSSGAPLFKRGYRKSAHPAPLNEVLAAGMILLSGWNGEEALIDPMCGSGTLLIEAGLIAANRPPNAFRETFAFQKWADFDEDLWALVKKEAAKNETTPAVTLQGSDQSARSIQHARANVSNAGLSKGIRLTNRAFDESSPPGDRGTLILNPPYGERLKQDDINGFYKKIGDTLKQKYSGHTAWILSSNSEAIKYIGLRPSKKVILYNGSLECKFLKFDLYAGSKKAKYLQP